MSSSDSVATATENASRLGYKHVCVNYLHVASHDYQYVTHTRTQSHTYIYSRTHTHTGKIETGKQAGRQTATVYACDIRLIHSKFHSKAANVCTAQSPDHLMCTALFGDTLTSLR